MRDPIEEVHEDIRDKQIANTKGERSGEDETVAACEAVIRKYTDAGCCHSGE